jgi:hypothetical protein
MIYPSVGRVSPKKNMEGMEGDDQMTTTYHIKPNEVDAFLQIFRASFMANDLLVTVETLPDTDDTYQRMVRSLEAEKRGELVHSMTVDELEAMI